jgi:hypothetical protein
LAPDLHMQPRTGHSARKTNIKVIYHDM